MSGVDIAGLVERLRAVADAHGNTALHPYCLYAKAADALLAQAAELAEAREKAQLFDDAAFARDASGFAGTVPDCIAFWCNAIEASEAEQNAIAAALPGVRFMDPPDGGSPSLAEQVKRMREALDAAEHERDEALAALKASEWQPIETAPKDGTVVLLRIPGEHPRVEAAFWNLGSGAEPDPQFPWTTLDGVYGTNGYGEDRPDGWGPLPSPQGRIPELADATNNPPSDPGTEQREAGR